MSPLPHRDMELLNTFVKSAQYIVGLSSHQDLWDHVERLLVTYFQADWAAFVRQDGAGGLSVDHGLLPGSVVSQQLLTDQVRTIIHDVLESGFLACQVVPMPAPSMTVFLPLAGEHQTGKVLLIGHNTVDPLPRERLNIYLALSGLAGTMLERLHFERELNLHRVNLEELVKARTGELAKAKRQNELILDSIGEGIFGVDADGRIVFVNPCARQMTGWDVTELIGRHAHDTFHHTRCDGSVYPMEECVLHATLRTGQTHHVADGQFFRKDGSDFPVEFKTTPIAEDGSIVGAVLVFRDITDRRRAQLERETTIEFLRLFVEHAPAAIAMLDAQMRFVAVSDRWMTDYSLRGRQILGHSYYEVFCEVPDRWKEIHRRCLAGAVERAEEDAFQRPDGSVQWVRWEVRPWQAAGGAIGGIIVFSEDITERKQAEQQLKELNATLEQRVSERTAEAEHRAAQLRALAAQLTQAEQKERQRLATILHDHLQQLLVGTKFHLGILRAQLQAPQQHESLKQVDNLLDESLDASRSLTVDLCPPILQQGTMPQVLEWLAEWFGGRHGLAVETRSDEHADPQDQDVRVLLFQAVRELLFNVVKHAKVRQACVELSCAADGRIKVVVSDAGAGFDPSQSSMSKREGSGFGLFNIRERLDWLGGSLEIQSAPGQGTRTTLIAPMGLKTPSADVPVVLAVAAASGARAFDMPTGASRSKIRVLLADDHAVMRDGLTRLLQTQPDMEVVGQAADGLQVVDLARQVQPDVVVMDISMPHLDGVEATRQLKAQQPRVQVVGLSMFNEEGVVEAMKTAGAACYLAKTSGPDALVAAIRKHAARSTSAEPERTTEQARRHGE